MSWIQQLDGNILLWIQENIRKEFLDPIIIFISCLGNAGWFWLVLLAVMLFSVKYRRVGLTGLVSVLIGFIITNLVLKNTVARIRPYEVVEGLRFLGVMPTDYSFPSGHSTCSMAASVVLFLKLPRKTGVPALLLGILICLSRLYVGVHYPTDVLAGMLIGTASAFAAVYLFRMRTQSKTYAASILQKGALGGEIVIENDKMIFQTGKQTVSAKIRNLNMEYKYIKQIVCGRILCFSTIEVTLDTEKYKFIVFNRRNLLKDLKQMNLNIQ